MIGQDGSAHVDLINNTYQLDQATKYIDAGDRFLRRLRQSWQVFKGGLGGFLGYGLSTLGVLKRTDAYYASMLGRARAYDAGFRQTEKTPGSAQKGLWVIRGLEDSANDYRSKTNPVVRLLELPPAIPEPKPKTGDVLVLGGTGFIGRHLVKGVGDNRAAQFVCWPAGLHWSPARGHVRLQLAAILCHRPPMPLMSMCPVMERRVAYQPGEWMFGYLGP